MRRLVRGERGERMRPEGGSDSPREEVIGAAAVDQCAQQGGVSRGGCSAHEGASLTRHVGYRWQRRRRRCTNGSASSTPTLSETRGWRGKEGGTGCTRQRTEPRTHRRRDDAATKAGDDGYAQRSEDERPVIEGIVSCRHELTVATRDVTPQRQERRRRVCRLALRRRSSGVLAASAQQQQHARV